MEENKITWQVEGVDKIHDLPAVKPIKVRFEGANGIVEVTMDEDGCLHISENIPLCCKNNGDFYG